MYPGWSGQVAGAFATFMASGVNPNFDLFNVEQAPFWHRQVVATAITNPINWFNTGVAEAVTNWPAAQGLPADTAFKCDGIGFHIELNADVNGDEVAGGECLGGHATAPTQHTLIEQVRGLMDQGEVIMTCGGRRVTSGYGLSQFPAGHGAFITPAVSTNSATTFAYMATPITNGVPINGNFFRFDEAFPILPQKTVNVSWKLKTARTLAVSIAVKCCLYGSYFYPSNR